MAFFIFIFIFWQTEYSLMQYVSVNSPSHSTSTRKGEKFKGNFGVGLRKENDLKQTKNLKIPQYNKTGLKACPRI